ncbi:7621_t:CDS:2, partial [Racocetra fulgida]
FASSASNLPSNKRQSFQESTNSQYQEIEQPAETIFSDEENERYLDEGEETSVTTQVRNANNQTRGIKDKYNRRKTSDVTTPVPASKASNLPSNKKQSFQKSTTNQYQEIEPIETISSDKGSEQYLDEGEETSANNYDSLGDLNTKKTLYTSTVLPSRPIVTTLTEKTSHVEITTSNNRNDFELPLNLSNKFEVALWLACQPQILNLAIDIRDAMSDQISNNGNNNELSSNITHLYNPKLAQQEIKQ